MRLKLRPFLNNDVDTDEVTPYRGFFKRPGTPVDIYIRLVIQQVS